MHLYKLSLASLKPFILRNGGQSFDVDDVVQDAIIICYENIKEGRFTLQTSIAAYIYTIGKYMWYKARKKGHKLALTESVEVEEIDTDLLKFELFSTSKVSFVQELFEHLNEGCKKILNQTIYQQLPMKVIAELNGLKNEQIARNKKYKCLKRLQELIAKSNRFQKLIKEFI